MAQNISNYGLFIPTTFNLDVAQLRDVDVNSQEFKELLVRLYQTVNSMVISLNLKDTGYYLQQEFVTGAQFFNINNDFNNTRAIYRDVVNFGALPASGTKSVAHNIPNITNTWSTVKLYGSATNPSLPPTDTFIPIPYSSASTINDNLELSMDSTKVYITTGGTDYSAWTTTWVIIEYIKE